MEAGGRRPRLQFADDSWQCGLPMTVIKALPPLTSFTLRQCRQALSLSQADFAAQLGVPLETYRTWDSGRRPARLDVLTKANALALPADPHASLPLATIARLIHVHVRTLNAAARDGRLQVTYDTRTTFRSLRTRATLTDAETFLCGYDEKGVWPKVRPTPLTWDQIPPDYDAQIRRIRRRLRLTQAAFAARVGAARKAVVYQWESRKRCPSPVFWQRIRGLGARPPETVAGG